MTDLTATTAAPIHEVLANRRSPRAFDPAHTFAAGELTSVLEAARWAPSAYNHQPWRFVVAKRGTALHSSILATLVEFNQLWAGHASALIVNIAETANPEGEPIPTAEYDLGQAVAQLAVQAHSEGLMVHQMTGVDFAALTSVIGADPRFKVVSVAAIGKKGDISILPENLAAIEHKPRERRELSETVIAGEL